MAEGWARHLQSDTFDAYSAGIETHGLNPSAVRVMKEAGVDISSHYSKTLHDLQNIDFDYVITVCGHAHETCPVFPGETDVIHIGFDDPPKRAREIAEKGGSEDEQLDCYRRVRDEIRDMIEKLPTKLSF